MKHKSHKGKVFVGLSGGVDSSVAAALLQSQGYEVVGVFIRAWEGVGDQTADGEAAECGWRAERRDAMRVAAALDLPLLTLDLVAEYRREVVEYLLREYRAGRTPNPDVSCNRAIKFGGFYQWALGQGADFVATGHYAQNIERQGVAGLGRAKDENKDQTYFLWTLTADQLAHALFPIGNLLKSEVRQLAEKFKLPTAAKKDSQGVCFIGELDMKDFLKQELKSAPGRVENERGETVGEHEGAIFYTIGERHGFTVRQTSAEQKPQYVVARDLERNVLVVSDEPERIWGQRQNVRLAAVNLIGGSLPAGTLLARIRHRGELVPCRVAADGPALVVHFDQPPSALALGQSLVFYDHLACLGGGVIDQIA